ncbi:MAG: hypothetical protein HYR56_11445 [Acidobacteria bacterium]|nr:hypothetical protein [Acidobacteriota bacterium]MBI3428217.1 hypothetical protein [Acidobacteriota bacterium]
MASAPGSVPAAAPLLPYTQLQADLMRERGIIVEAPTTDKHCVQEGFTRLLDP